MPVGKEDCLVLNVFVKQLNTDPQTQRTASASPTKTTTTTITRKPTMTEEGNRKKVIVWIHGGGLVAGGATDYPAGSFVTTQDVILVAINYRLGILGFLSTEDVASPGNYGMWDQVMALRWVKNNIASFGGDSDDITISGESAGGAAVAFLSIVPSTRDLFTKSFPMSGTGTSIFAIAKDAQNAAIDVARETGCLEQEDTGLKRKLTLEESQKLVECLRDVPTEVYTKLAPFSLEKAKFMPRVDGDFLPRHPFALLKDDQYLESVGFFNRTYIFNVVNSEKAVMQGAVEATESVLKNLYDKTDEEKEAMVSEIHNKVYQFYLSSRLNIASPSDDLTSKVLDWYNRRLNEKPISTLVTDLSFIIPTYDYLNAVARSKTTNAYFLYFNHYPGFMHGKHRGIVHAADMLYWFDIDIDVWEKLPHVGFAGDMDQEDLDLKLMFSDMVGQFMRTSNPADGLQEEIPGGWPTFDIQGNYYLDFGPKPVARRHLDREKRDFWIVTVPKWAASASSTSTP